MEKKLSINELGTITLIRGSRYKRYSLKVSGGQIIATMPEQSSEQRMLAFIADKKDKLLQLLQKQAATSPTLLDETTEWQTATFLLRITRAENEQPRLKVSLREDTLIIQCPLRTRFEDEIVQSRLREILKNVFRREAKRTLPARLANLALQYGFTYDSVKINSSRTRWGSCSQRKSINLSLYLMKLPWHLIDYVLLHELCHTVEMNHGEPFWAHMNRVTAGKAKSLRTELTRFH